MGRAGLELELESWIPSLGVYRVGFVEQARVLHLSGESGDQKLIGIEREQTMDRSLQRCWSPLCWPPSLFRQ